MVVPGVGEHPLQYNYTFWYSRRTPGRPASTQSYEQNIKQIGGFASVRLPLKAPGVHLMHTVLCSLKRVFVPEVVKNKLYASCMLTKHYRDNVDLSIIHGLPYFGHLNL